MVQFSGRVKSSSIVDGEQRMVFIIPAFSERLALRRAEMNGRIKDIGNAEITDIEQVDAGDLPGQNIFEVTLVGER